MKVEVYERITTALMGEPSAQILCGAGPRSSAPSAPQTPSLSSMCTAPSLLECVRSTPATRCCLGLARYLLLLHKIRMHETCIVSYAPAFKELTVRAVCASAISGGHLLRDGMSRRIRSRPRPLNTKSDGRKSPLWPRFSA